MKASVQDRVAAEIRAEMGRQRMSGSMLAQQLGVSQMYVSRRLAGEIPFDIADLACVAEILDVPMTQFLPAEANGPPDNRPSPR